MDLINEQQDKANQLSAMIEVLRTKGRVLAEQEGLYRIALAMKIIELRNDGVPVTIINDLARGNKEIAHKRALRDIADAEYQAIIEKINVTKLQCRILENQISREWGNNK